MGLVWHRRLLVFCALVVTLAVPDLRAEDALRQQLQDCLEVPSALRRLDCFDRLARSSVSDDAEPPAPSPPADQRASGAEERFGTESQRRQAASRSAEANVVAVSSRIARVERRPRGEFVFHLENGQIWTEIEAGRGAYERDMEVTIRQTRLGGFMLSSDGARATRVRRID